MAGSSTEIKLFSVKDARQPYPLTAEEQALLFNELPDHLAQMALYKVVTFGRQADVNIRETGRQVAF